MDHLLHPRSPKHDPIEVPYLCIEEYDGGPLETFPKRKGWEGLANPNSTLSFIQTWLFFGLLHTVFAGRINTQMFISYKGNPYRAVVDTSILPQVASDWIDEQRVLDHATREERRVQTRSAVVFVARCMEAIYFAAENPIGLKIIFSIELLGEFLQSASLRAFDTSLLHDWRHYGADEVNWMNHSNFKSKSLVHQQLRDDGWCPYEIASFTLKFPGSGLYYISNLDRPGPAKDHSKCTEFKCFAYQLVNKEYKPRHCTDGCNCPFAYDKSDRVRRILLKEGSFPIISYVGVGDEETLHVVKALPDLEYVAISHVWSDGLGNLKHNALPRCQLKRLSALTTAALQYTNKSCDPFFWVDTVCCPPEDGEAQDLAISRMRETYEKATCVLVLDSWLQNQPIKELSDCEILVRIACSGWNRRLWTFQEGALAQSLLFQFADGIFDLDRAASELYGDRNISYDLILKTSIAKQMLGTRSLRILELGNTLRIKAIMSSLKFRSTSVASDEALCLGAMLNLDVMGILKASNTLEGRMAALWRMLPEVPADLILFGGRRLDAESLCWAPATLLSSRNPGWAGIVKYTDERSGATSPRGLHARFPGFMLSCQSGTIFRTFHFAVPETRHWFQVCCYRTLTSENAIQQEEDGRGAPVDGTIVVRSPENSGPGLVRLGLITQVAVFCPEVPVEVRSAGILATVTEMDGGVVFARFLCDATVQFAARDDGSPGFNQWLHNIQNAELAVNDDVQINEMFGAETCKNQAWCIG